MTQSKNTTVVKGALAQDPHSVKEVREKVLEIAIGREVRSLRRQQNITVAELSATTGLSIGMLSKIENGNTSASLTTLQTLAHALSVPLTAFFKGLICGVSVRTAAPQAQMAEDCRPQLLDVHG